MPCPKGAQKRPPQPVAVGDTWFPTRRTELTQSRQLTFHEGDRVHYIAMDKRVHHCTLRSWRDWVCMYACERLVGDVATTPVTIGLPVQPGILPDFLRKPAPAPEPMPDPAFIPAPVAEFAFA